jgi:hypothetical protein
MGLRNSILCLNSILGRLPPNLIFLRPDPASNFSVLFWETTVPKRHVSGPKYTLANVPVQSWYPLHRLSKKTNDCPHSSPLSTFLQPLASKKLLKPHINYPTKWMLPMASEPFLPWKVNFASALTQPLWNLSQPMHQSHDWDLTWNK